jgi:predicted enzyme related to lactoylglutathione lyase
VILVADLDDVESRITSAGGEIYASHVEVPGGLATTFADPVVGAPLIVSVNAS